MMTDAQRRLALIRYFLDVVLGEWPVVVEGRPDKRDIIKKLCIGVDAPFRRRRS